MSRGALLRSLDTSLKRLGVDYVDLWQVHTWVDGAARGDAVGAGPRGQQRAGGVRRGVQLHRLADRAGRDLAACGRRASDPGVHAGGVLPAQPRGRARGDPGPRSRSDSAYSPGPRSAAAYSPASTAPASPPTRGPHPTTSPTSWRATSARAADRRGGRPGRRRARLDAAGGGTRLGPRPPGSHRADHRRPHRRPAQARPRARRRRFRWS